MLNQFVSEQLKRLRPSPHAFSEESLKNFAANSYGQLGYTIITEVNKTLSIFGPYKRGRFVLFALSQHRNSEGVHKTHLFLRNGEIAWRNCRINGDDLTLAE